MQPARDLRSLSPVSQWTWRALLGGALITVALGTLSCATAPTTPTTIFVSTNDLEKAHGLKLVPSARNCQQVHVGSLTNRGSLSVFEMDQNELALFIRQLRVKSRSWPATSSPGDPRVSGEGVWPPGSGPVVPAKAGPNGLQRTWNGGASPIEMLSCNSSTGNWLRVEIWSVEDHTLIKLYTDGN
jgi:hypothetical protein